MPAGARHFPDPGLTYGHFRVLPRTDGKWAVFDDRRKPGESTVKTFRKKGDAIDAAEAWHRLGHG